ncbi:MAG: BON domain-containing protein [Bdellovibrionales bacterium]|nr:BON domain-containing protein [Bdellovibrionales bacterium]
MKPVVAKNQISKRDEILINRIRKRIKWDTRVSNSDVVIQAKKGEVTLTGSFDKQYRREAAVDLVSSTQGVLKFVDKSRVVPEYFRESLELEKLITKKIQLMQLPKGEWIEVSVKNGVVEFDGLVSMPRIKGFASRIAWELSGVQDCVNRIKVQREPSEIDMSMPSPNVIHYKTQIPDSIAM